MNRILTAQFDFELGNNARAAHTYMLRPASHDRTRTLFTAHDHTGSLFTIVTDDQQYDPTMWGKKVLRYTDHRYDPTFRLGEIREFTVRLNTIKRAHLGCHPEAHRDTHLGTQDELEEFITQRMQAAGADLLEYSIEPQQRLYIPRSFDETRELKRDGFLPTNRRQPSTVARRFHGLMMVTDTDLCRNAHLNGMGRARSFGCGLILSDPHS